MRSSLLLLVLLGACGLRGIAQDWHPKTDPNWELVEEDNFDSIKTSVWESRFPWNQGEHGPIVFPGINDTLFAPEIAYYTWDYRNIVRKSDTTFAIRSRKEPVPIQGEIWEFGPCIPCKADYEAVPQVQQYYINDQGRPATHYSDTAICDQQADGNWTCFFHPKRTYTHTTGVLVSKKEFKYGYFELKFRVPPGGPPNLSCGPSFWLFGAGDERNKNSEVDLFELISTNNNKYSPNLHFKIDSAGFEPGQYEWHGYDNHPEMFRSEVNYLDTSWHVATMYWSEDSVQISMDGMRIANFPTWASQLNPMYVILGTGYPAENYGKTDISVVPDQYDFEFDYFRVYQQKRHCGSTVNRCNYISAYDGGVYQSFSLGGPNCNYAPPTGSVNNHLVSDFGLLRENFQINNTEFSVDVAECPFNQPKLVVNSPYPPDYTEIIKQIGFNKLNAAKD